VEWGFDFHAVLSVARMVVAYNGLQREVDDRTALARIGDGQRHRDAENSITKRFDPFCLSFFVHMSDDRLPW
jgi:hypothetical protein